MDLYALVVIILLALIFDFINGFHDAANSIATIVSTRVLKPQHAVIWAAAFNFIAFLFFETRVANTIGRGLVDPAMVSPAVIFSSLFGAIAWNLVTWYFALPSSSSHALVGGLVGSVLVRAGSSALQYEGLLKVLVSIVLSPFLGLILASLLSVLTAQICKNLAPRLVDKWFRRLQFFSAALYSLGHGGNDAQKTMGIIAILLFSAGYLGPQFHVPFWVILLCQTAMGLGTLMGGWKIVKTMGLKITKLKPIGGFSAETAGAMTLFLATGLGIPVSTTHTITGAIVGAGSVYSPHTIRWGIASRIIWAWILTIPAAAAISALTLWVIRSI
ncbi:MAG: inorganic phosphate transporter [Bdellovibrionia bacterium]